MHRYKTLLILVGVTVLGAATAAFAGGGREDRRGDDRPGWHHDRGKAHERSAAVKLRDADGERVGRVWLKEHGRDGAVTVFARVANLPPGFHGFHSHTTGGSSHGDHAGDLPTLLVNEDGTGMLAATTDRFSLDDLRDDDGAAVMVHELADNYANIPERYAPDGPDEDTLATGDAGSRLACGVVR